MNTSEGSQRIIRGGGARSLNGISGRGIWQYESKKVVFQGPYILDYEIEKVINRSRCIVPVKEEIVSANDYNFEGDV